jgi:hypothetical protein
MKDDIKNIIDDLRGKAILYNIEEAPEDDNEDRWDYESLRDDFGQVYDALLKIENIIKK